MTIWFGFLGEKMAAKPPFSPLFEKKGCHSERSEETLNKNIVIINAVRNLLI